LFWRKNRAVFTAKRLLQLRLIMSHLLIPSQRLSCGVGV
jgi:hypothetical protein